LQVTVAAVQPCTDRVNEKSNVSIALKYIDEAADKGAKIVCFPEGYPGPYRGPLTYSALQVLSEKAKERGVYVIAGAVEKAEKYRKLGIKNAFLLALNVIGPRGQLVGTYRRVQPNPPDTDRFFMGEKTIAPGEELPVFKTEYGTLGFLICSEIWCPELARVLALKGAEIIFAPMGGAVYEVSETWKVLLWARAIENNACLVTTQNLWGMEDGMAAIYGPEEILAESKKPGVLTATVDLNRIRWLREHMQKLVLPKPYKALPGMLMYRRPELYKEICQPQPNAYDFYYFKKGKRLK